MKYKSTGESNVRSDKVRELIANTKLLEVFGDEENYNRYILIKINKQLTDIYSMSRGDALYMSCMRALRAFDQGYEEFSRYHNSDRFPYSVIKSGKDELFRLELGVFACGYWDTKNYYMDRVAYYDYSSNNPGRLIRTPKMIDVDFEHPNYEYIKQNIGYDREASTPFINMDAKTLSAFTYFRAMTYHLYIDYIMNGYDDELEDIKVPSGLYTPSDCRLNPYVAYTLALRTTSNFFKNFFPPEAVTFTNAKLPYKNFKIIERDLQNIKIDYKIDTIGSIRHFASAKNLPALKFKTVDILKRTIKQLVNLGDFKGKGMTSDEQASAQLRYDDMLRPSNDLRFDKMGRRNSYKQSTHTLDMAEESKMKEMSKSIDRILKETSTIIDGKRDYQVSSHTKTFIKSIPATIENLTRHKDKIFDRLYDLKFPKAEIEFLQAPKSQLPMTIDFTLNNQKLTIPYGNIRNLIQNDDFGMFVDKLREVGRRIYSIIDHYNEIVHDCDKLERRGITIKQMEKELDAKDETQNQEAKEYKFTSVETLTTVTGTEKERDLNQSKLDFVSEELNLKYSIESIDDDYKDIATLMDETKAIVSKMESQGQITEGLLKEVTDLLNIDDIALEEVSTLGEDD